MRKVMEGILTENELREALRIEDRIELCKRMHPHCLSQENRDELIEKINELQERYYKITGELYQQNWYTGV